MLMPCLGLRMTSASRGMSDCLTVDLSWYFRKIDETRIFSSISANLQQSKVRDRNWLTRSRPIDNLKGIQFSGPLSILPLYFLTFARGSFWDQLRRERKQRDSCSLSSLVEICPDQISPGPGRWLGLGGGETCREWRWFLPGLFYPQWRDPPPAGGRWWEHSGRAWNNKEQHSSVWPSHHLSASFRQRSRYFILLMSWEVAGRSLSSPNILSSSPWHLRCISGWEASR